MAYVSKNASKEPNPITPDMLEASAKTRRTDGDEHTALVYEAAAKTIRALQMAEASRVSAQCVMDQWQERALAAEQALEALRAETAALREIERCKASINASGATYTEITGCTVPRWQSAERAAWEHAADPFRARIEAAGFELKLRFAEGGNNPIEIVRCASIDDNLWEVSYHAGDLGGSPTLDALKEAAAWAEAHPANVDPGAPGGDCTVETTWQDGAVVNVQCEPAPAPAPAPCSCGHVHSGCAECAYARTRYYQEPCRRCATVDPKRACLWTPKPAPEFFPIDTPAARALLALMQRLSEQCWAAGWLDGTEYDLWKRVESGDRLWGLHYVSQQDLDDLRHWSNECGGWIVHQDDKFWVVPLNDWRRMYSAHTPA